VLSVYSPCSLDWLTVGVPPRSSATAQGFAHTPWSLLRVGLEEIAAIVEAECVGHYAGGFYDNSRRSRRLGPLQRVQTTLGAIAPRQKP